MLARDLVAASFRGVSFLCPSDELSEGRTTIDHLFPDANFRYAEDNGGIPPKFKLSMLLGEPGLPGKVKSLRRALTAQGPGTLRHPWVGAQFVQVQGDYTIKRSQKHAGYVEIEATFLVTGPPQFPGLTSAIPALVSGLSAQAVLDLFAEFVREFGDPRTLSNATLVVLANAIEDMASALLPALAPASSDLPRLRDEAGSFVVNSEALAAAMSTALRAPLDPTIVAVDAPGTSDGSTGGIPDADLINAYDRLASVADGFATAAASIDATTRDLANRQVALSILSGYIQAAAFICLAESVAIGTYDTAEDVERVEILMTNHFEALQERNLSTTVRAALGEIYVAASDVLRELAVRLPRIVPVPASNTPASVLAYMLYEDRFKADSIRTVEERAGVLVRLNLSQTPLVLAGDVNAVMGG
jgi:prophage DNA circulation protein